MICSRPDAVALLWETQVTNHHGRGTQEVVVGRGGLTVPG